MTIIYAIIMFCLLIFVHELGHFITAKACGIKVNEFALGMGPAFFKRTRGETTYSLRAVPIGGFCAMEGEDEDSQDSRAFNNKPAWKRAIVLVAGSAMNLLLCIIVLSAIALYSGSPTTTIEQVSPKAPAAEAGIQKGDQIVAIDGKNTDNWQEITEAIGAADEKVSVEVQRNGQAMTIHSDMTEAEDGRKIIGIVPGKTHNPFIALKSGVQSSWMMTKMMVKTIGQLFTGDVSTKELTGPVGIVYAVNDTAKYGVVYLLYLTALISLNLAIVNMLPWPALDGGRLLFLVIRKLTGKTISDETEGKIHFVGIMLLFGLMIYVTFNDVVRFIVPIFN